jgi:hypothetical protein
MYIYFTSIVEHSWLSDVQLISYKRYFDSKQYYKELVSILETHFYYFQF